MVDYPEVMRNLEPGASAAGCGDLPQYTWPPLLYGNMLESYFCDDRNPGGKGACPGFTDLSEQFYFRPSSANVGDSGPTGARVGTHTVRFGYGLDKWFEDGNFRKASGDTYYSYDNRTILASPEFDMVSELLCLPLEEM